MAAMHVRTLSDMMQSFPVWKRDFGVVDDDISIQDVEGEVSMSCSYTCTMP